MKIKKILFMAGLFAAALTASAMVDSVKLLVVGKDGKTTEEVVKLEKVGADTMRLRIPFKRYSRNRWLQIKHIDILSDDAAAKKGDPGYWISPDGRLGEFDKDNGTVGEARSPMQMYGFKKGDEAFVAIVKGLKYEYTLFVEAKDGAYKMFPRFNIAQIGMPIYEDLIIDLTYFKGKDANYSSMGREYRKYQLDRGEVVPLKERIQGNPRLKYSSESIVLKFTMANSMYESTTGPTYRGYHWKDTDTPNIKVVRNFDNMMATIKKLKDMGIDKADIIVTNWNLHVEGHSPIYGVAEPELGGNEKCKQFTALGKKLGFQISPHIMHTENYTVSPAFKKEDLALQQDGGYNHYEGLGGEAYEPCWKQVFLKQVLSEYTNMQLLGFNGPVHIDVTSAIGPYRCFDLNHFCTMNDTAFYMNQVGLLSDAFFGGWGSEGPCDQAANTLDYALYVSAYPRYLGADNPLLTRLIPLWQIVYHGIIMSNPLVQTIDYNCPPRTGGWGAGSFTQEMRRLKLVEFGGRPTYYWSLSDKNLPFVKKGYDEYQPLKYLQYEFMDFHGEIAKDVFLTRYSDGSQIVTNYTDKEFNYKGKGIVKPKDYTLFKPDSK